MNELRAVFLHYITLIITGALMTAAAFISIWWENRKASASGIQEAPAGTLIHIDGIPYRLRERTLIWGMTTLGK